MPRQSRRCRAGRAVGREAGALHRAPRPGREACRRAAAQAGLGSRTFNVTAPIDPMTDGSSTGSCTRKSLFGANAYCDRRPNDSISPCSTMAYWKWVERRLDGVAREFHAEPARACGGHGRGTTSRPAPSPTCVRAVPARTDRLPLRQRMLDAGQHRQPLLEQHVDAQVRARIEQRQPEDRELRFRACAGAPRVPARAPRPPKRRCPDARRSGHGSQGTAWARPGIGTVPMRSAPFAPLATTASDCAAPRSSPKIAIA